MTTLALRPRGARLLVRKDEAEAEIAGIHIPAEAREEPTSGVIVAVGEKQQEFHVEQRILFSRFAGEKLTMDGDTLYFLDAEEVLGYLRAAN